MTGDTYEERLQDLVAEYEKYLDEHGGRVLLRPDITVRLDFMNLTLIENRVLLEQMLAHLGVTVPESTPEETPEGEALSLKWEATEPEEIFKQALLTADTFYSDRMVDWRQGKRIYFFVESTLDQPIQIQVIGNKTDNKDGATDIGSAQACPAHDNISLAPAWEQWCPYIGIKITASVAPASGLLTISVVRQE
jgi:hypothetical protein